MKCSECDLEFLNENILSLHMKFIHKENTIPNQPIKNSSDYLITTKCDKVFFKTSTDLKQLYEENDINDIARPLILNEHYDPIVVEENFEESRSATNKGLTSVNVSLTLMPYYIHTYILPIYFFRFDP